MIVILKDAFGKISLVLEKSGRNKRKRWDDVSRDRLVAWLLGDNTAQSIANELLDALSQGASEADLSGAVSYAASLRVAQFHTRNEFGDWAAVLHTLTFANAIDQGLRRLKTTKLLRGVFDAAMRIYLNRFLNIPLTPIPKPSLESVAKEKGIGDNTDNNINKNDDDGAINAPKSDTEILLLNELPSVLDGQQQTNQTGQLVAITFTVEAIWIYYWPDSEVFCCVKTVTFIPFK